MDTIRQKAEAIWLEKSSTENLYADRDLSEIIQELYIHQIELELQNDELRASQKKLNDLQKKYFDLYNLAPVGYFKFDDKGIILEVNIAGAALLNRQKYHLPNTPFFKHLLPQDRPVFFQQLDLVFQTKNQQTFEVTLLDAQNEPVYFQVDATPLEEDGRWICHAAFTDVTNRKKAERLQKDALEEKEILLKEIHHRVKNNLQIISSLLYLQSEYISDPSLKIQFLESQRRVKTMSLIHEQLYQNANLAHIDFEKYVTDLTGNLLQIHLDGQNRISLHLEIAPTNMDIDTAIPCGLIINELVSNALKYAFPNNQTGIIQLKFRRLENGKHLLSVHDDGVGLPQDIATADATPRELNAIEQRSLGLQLVTALTAQLGGYAQIQNNNGTHVEITF